MSIRLIDKPRGTGKTSELIYASEITGYPIVVNNINQVIYISQMAKEMNCKIPEPIIETELLDKNCHVADKVLIDEGTDIISKALDSYFNVHVVAVTFTSINQIKEKDENAFKEF